MALRQRRVGRHGRLDIGLRVTLGKAPE
jgi:hypothetical protein